MLQIPFLDLIIAVVFIYFLFSLFATLIVEIIVNITQKRGKLLKTAFNKMLNDQQNINWSESFYEHPLVANLQKREGRLPNYISSKIFSLVLIDIFVNHSKDVKFDSTKTVEVEFTESLPSENTFENFKAGIAKMKKSEVKIWLEALLHSSADLSALKMNIQEWYDEYMGRVSGWYKISTRELLLWIAIPIVIIFNINIINITRKMTEDASLRDKLVDVAINNAFLRNVKPLLLDSANLSEKIEPAYKVYQEIKDNRFPIGWKNDASNAILSKLYHLKFNEFELVELLELFFGWVLSAFAIQRGAPFWFEILNYLVNMRNSGKKPESISIKKD